MQTQQRYYTPEEYLALEEAAEFRSEYQDGEIVPMTGGTINHNRIVLNLVAFFKYALRGKGFEPFSSDLRVWIPQPRQYTYPDVFVIQGKPVFQEKRKDTVMNPCLIIEVLSQSTEQHDRTQKFRYYRSIAEFQEYVLIDQYSIHVERYTKMEDGSWLLRDYDDATAILPLTSVELEIAIADLYEGVNFEQDSLEAEQM